MSILRCKICGENIGFACGRGPNQPQVRYTVCSKCKASLLRSKCSDKAQPDTGKLDEEKKDQVIQERLRAIEEMDNG